MGLLIAVPYLMIGAAVYGLFIHLPYCCIRYGWRITLYGFTRSF